MKRVKRKQFFGVAVPVISVEDNIIFKAILQRGEEEGKHDIDHIKDMIKHEKIDLEYLRKRVKQCKAEKRVMPLLKTLIPNF
jgi:predicted nucleotidyltransferase